MLRIALAMAFGFSVVTLSGLAVSAADDKTLEGKLVCTKCKLSETDKCGNALIVKEGGKDVTYYIADKGKAEKYHKCSGEKDATVTGKVVEKDGKKTIEGAKVK